MKATQFVSSPYANKELGVPAKFHFDSDKVAYYEKAGWEAYYDHAWLRALRLMVQLNREQFAMPLLTAIAAALDTVRASIAFAPLDNDVAKAQHFITRFYEKAAQRIKFRADARTVAALEMDYWVVHRRLALARIKDPSDDSLDPLIRSIENLHSALFEAPAPAIRSSAVLRARAAEAVDRITGKRSADVAADWRLVEDLLQQAYRVVQPAVA